MRACPQRAHAAGPFLRAAREGAGADGLSVAAHGERGRSAAGVHEIEILVAVACASPGADMMRACKSRRGREARKSWRGCDARKSRRGCEKHTWQGRLVGSSAHRRPASVCLVARCVVASKEGNRRCPKGAAADIRTKGGGCACRVVVGRWCCEPVVYRRDSLQRTRAAERRCWGTVLGGTPDTGALSLAFGDLWSGFRVHPVVSDGGRDHRPV